MPVHNLWVIMPAFNEAEAIDFVVKEWTVALDNTGVPYTLCILNDGSWDLTLAHLRRLEAEYPRIQVIDKPNSGHGQTCIYGYKYALRQGADWIFQVDSDGQCDPVFLARFLQLAERNRCVYGVRVTRDDGVQRMVVSHFVSLFVFAATGRWLRDPNVPYRLIHAGVMSAIVDAVGGNFHLANICVTVSSDRMSKIAWVPIHFRKRMGGTPSVKTISFIKHGITLFRQLREAQKSL